MLKVSDRKLLNFLEYLRTEVNCEGEELNAYIKSIVSYEGYTEVSLRFIPEGLLPSGSYKLISRFCLSEEGEGCTIGVTYYTEENHNLYGMTVIIPEVIPSTFELWGS